MAPHAFVPLIALAFLAASCGDSEPAAGPKTSLSISVVADQGAAPKVLTLTCDPAGGDHPQAVQACAALDKAGASVFEPVPKDQACTMIYGGPQTAKVTGTYVGDAVDATFNRTNGCEINRWEKLGTTFFDLPLQ